jgi:hypothetical protein
MVVWSVLVFAAGVCANPIATSRAGIAISKNALFMGILRRFSPCGGSEISLGILNLLPILMSNPCGFRGSGVRTWSIQVKPNDLIR